MSGRQSKNYGDREQRDRNRGGDGSRGGERGSERGSEGGSYGGGYNRQPVRTQPGNRPQGSYGGSQGGSHGGGSTPRVNRNYGGHRPSGSHHGSSDHGSGSDKSGKRGHAPPYSRTDSSAASSSSSLRARFDESVQIQDKVWQPPLKRVVPAGSGKTDGHPFRPDYGSVGRKVFVRGNHFPVAVKDKDIFQYAFKIEPEVTSKALGRALMEKFIADYGESHFGQHKIAYDGRNILYTAGKLPFTSKAFELTLTEKNPRKYKISIEFTKCLDLHYLKEFLLGRQMECPQDIIQALDIVLREFPSKSYIPVARSYFSQDFGQPEAIGGGLECLRGYYQSLRPTQMGLSLNLDVAATSFYQPLSLIEFLSETVGSRLNPNAFPENIYIMANKAVKGIRVRTTHNSEATRNYRITGLTSQTATKLMFSVDAQGGPTISVAQYFKQKYNRNLQYPTYPCVQAGSSNKPTYLPMEVCVIVGGQRYSKKLSDTQVTSMLKAACKKPFERESTIFKICKHNNYNNDMHAREFGMNIDPRLTQMEARILPPPTLKYGGTGQDTKCNPYLGAWNMTGKRLHTGSTINTWACICFSERTGSDAINNFCNLLANKCNEIGMNFNPNPIAKTYFDRANNIEYALRAVYQASKNLQMLIVILPDGRGSYGRIKTICETELGIVTQCCQAKNLNKLSPQFLANVALKINAKAGGKNVVLDDFISKKVRLVNEDATIIFGADVTHPSPGEDSQSSIAAVVASVDWPQMTTYRCRVSSQQHHQEMIENLYKAAEPRKGGNAAGGMIRELLTEFYKVAKQKPKRIIFYRDGVSEGQFNQVLTHEVNAIRKACASLEENYRPPITFVIVQKRHHTRLFPGSNSQQDQDKNGNILPGTVVDKSICHPTEFDFYLCSHASVQGTSRPTHYHVLLDENKFTADELQTLTNNLCYTYARCTRAVSVVVCTVRGHLNTQVLCVPPAYYAHLAAFRARYYCEGRSEAGSSRGSSGMSKGASTRERAPELQSLPNIKENIKNMMFFC